MNDHYESRACEAGRPRHQHVRWCRHCTSVRHCLVFIRWDGLGCQDRSRAYDRHRRHWICPDSTVGLGLIRIDTSRNGSALRIVWCCRAVVRHSRRQPTCRSGNSLEGTLRDTRAHGSCGIKMARVAAAHSRLKASGRTVPYVIIPPADDVPPVPRQTQSASSGVSPLTIWLEPDR